MRSRWHGSVAALCVLGALVVGATPSAGAVGAQVRVSATPAGRPLPAGFLGLALEYSTVPRWFRHGTRTGNPVLVQLLRNLVPSGHAILRVGGLSTDRTWWPVPGMRRPPGITYNLTPEWTASARALALSTGARLLLGLNLQANRPRIDGVEAAHLLTGVGRGQLDAFEIGNEPDLYPLIPWYRRLGGKELPWYSHAGTPVYARRPTYGPSQFAAETARTLRVIPPAPIAGPETGSPPWMDAFARFLTPGGRVKLLTSHAYALNQCVTDPASPAYPSVAHLLALPASRSLTDGIAGYVARAHRAGAGYRVDEMGSISCNGRAGVSDTMASALWGVDALFAVASSGVDGVNLHSYPDSVNGLFDFSWSGGGWVTAVHPLYYGALMFADAAPPGSRLLATTGGSRPQLRAWATIAPDHRVRVLLINDSLASRADVRLHPPPGFAVHPAMLERLLAPTAGSTGGITLGGHGFGVESATGVLPPPVPMTVPSSSGAYTVSLPAASAALLTLLR